jgi:site-specific DNA recombinase
MKKNKVNFTSLEVLLQDSLTKQHKKKAQGREGRYGVIYTRVSSKEQAENNGSLETQLKNCKEYAARTGIIVKEYFGGIYESAKSDGRKEFQRMLAYVKKDKAVAFIIVWNYERFSRTGAGAMTLSQNLRKEGIHIKSITEELDTSTASGRMMENFHHIKNFWDNDTKSERTKNMTREVMLKGYWPYTTPLGYKNLKPKHRACNHEYVITEEGKDLQKAFQWKAEGCLSNKEIIDRLRVRGVRLTEKKLSLGVIKRFLCRLHHRQFAGPQTH